MAIAPSRSVDKPDICIVGGGIAGLYVAREILKASPSTQLLLLEKYPIIGGRVLSYKKDIGSADKQTVSWEAGAGRLYEKHERVHKLLKDYGLQTYLLSPSADFVSANGRRLPDRFAELVSAILPPLADLPVADLQKHTLGSLCRSIIGLKETKAIFEQFPYYTEVESLRADEGLRSFMGVMGSRAGFSGIKGGFGSLAYALAADVRMRGGTIWLGAELVGWSRSKEGLKAEVSLTHGSAAPARNVHIFPTKMVLALHATALRALRPAWRLLKHLGTARLLRIYAVFPKNRSGCLAGHVWFKGMNRVITPGKLRYIIPINEDQGTIMISYTDGADTGVFWEAANKDSPKQLTHLLMKEVRRLFGSNIPDPIFVKAHPWNTGTTYWKPGIYNIDKVIKESRQLEDDVYVCGESFSHEQAWIEGALESAEGLLADKFSGLSNK